MSEVRFCSQWAMVERGTMAPVAEVAPVVVAGMVAGTAEPVLSTANGRDVTPEGKPVRVPELMAAVVVDSLFDAAMAAMFEATGLVVVPAVGVAVVIEELWLVLELTSWPAEVGKAAEAPEGAEVELATGEDPDTAVAAAGVADPSRGTEAAAPVEPVLM